MRQGRFPVNVAFREHPDIVKKLSRDYSPRPFLVACAFVSENTIEALLEVYPKALQFLHLMKWNIPFSEYMSECVNNNNSYGG